MALFSGTKLTALNEELSTAEVPFGWRNKNPFKSMYFAVQSMAAELSTAAPAMLAIHGVDFKVALIIIDMSAEFKKKAKTKTSFTCKDVERFSSALRELKNVDDIITVDAQTEGKDETGEVVSLFRFLWSFKRLN